MTGLRSVAARLTWAVNAARIAPVGLERNIINDLYDQVERTPSLSLPKAFINLGIKNWQAPIQHVHTALHYEPPLPRAREYRRELQELHQWLKELSTASRIAGWQYRIGAELARARDHNWYTLLCTLTVDPSITDPEELLHEGTEWRRYRTRLSEEVRKQLHLEQPQRGGPRRDTYCRYFAIIEHGKSRQHHHIHALFFCKDIPTAWKRDPNIGRPNPNATDILPLKNLWPWGTITKCGPFRFLGDRWTREDWIFPTTLTNPKSAFEAGKYLTKYLTKEHKQWSHRTRATHGLGLTDLRRYLNSQTTSWLNAAATRMFHETSKPLLPNTQLPLHLLKREARLIAWERLWISPSGRKTLLNWVLTPTFPMYSEMRASVILGAKPWKLDSELTRNWLSGLVPLQERNVSYERQAKVLHDLEAWHRKREDRARQTLKGVPR